MINSTAFDYVNVLTKAADASWKRESILTNNISNVDTPGYKRKDLNFESVLPRSLAGASTSHLTVSLESWICQS